MTSPFAPPEAITQGISLQNYNENSSCLKSLLYIYNGSAPPLFEISQTLTNPSVLVETIIEGIWGEKTTCEQADSCACKINTGDSIFLESYPNI